MSDEPNDAPATGPTPEPVEPPAPVQNQGPGAGQVLAGIFLILFGVCIALAGGSCTVLWIIFVLGEGSGDGGFLFLISLATFAAGLVSIWAGVKLVRGR